MRGSNRFAVQILAKTLKQLKASHIPIAVSSMDVSRSVDIDVGIPLAGWAQDVDLEKYPGGLTYGSRAPLKAALRSGTANDPVLFLQLSPPVAAAEVVQEGAAEAGWLKGVIPVVMGGSFWGCYDIGTTQPCAEYNVAHNVTASQVFWGVPAASWAQPLRVVPTVPARVFVVNGTSYESLIQGAASSPAAASLLGAFKFWFTHGGQAMIGPLPWDWGPSVGTSAVYDLLAAWAAVTAVNTSAMQQQQAHQPGCVGQLAGALVWEDHAVTVLDSGLTQLCPVQGGHAEPGAGLNASSGAAHTPPVRGCVAVRLARGWATPPPGPLIGNVTACIASTLRSGAT